MQLRVVVSDRERDVERGAPERPAEPRESAPASQRKLVELSLLLCPDPDEGAAA